MLGLLLLFGGFSLLLLLLQPPSNRSRSTHAVALAATILWLLLLWLWFFFLTVHRSDHGRGCRNLNEGSAGTGRSARIERRWLQWTHIDIGLFILTKIVRRRIILWRVAAVAHSVVGVVVVVEEGELRIGQVTVVVVGVCIIVIEIVRSFQHGVGLRKGVILTQVVLRLFVQPRHLFAQWICDCCCDCCGHCCCSKSRRRCGCGCGKSCRGRPCHARETLKRARGMKGIIIIIILHVIPVIIILINIILVLRRQSSVAAVKAGPRGR
mmetsp:Transcript_20056/g.47942  ORF Transcript_20056/g.47942 Transcript_20056/m.47942 type:complete len:267 (-) Transcript_20056:433-1233(-)